MSWYKPWTWTDQSQQATDQIANQNDQGNRSSDFADTGQQGFGQLGTEAAAQRAALQRLATGQDSYSAEQLRQGLGQNVAAQRSMAAGGAPSSAPMMAMIASQNAARLGSGLAGQQALAGIAERQAAQKALADMILQQRQQDLQAALQGRATAVNAYGGVKPEGSFLDKITPLITAGMGVASMAATGGKK